MTKIKNNNKGYLFTALLFFSSQIIFAQTTISTTSVITMDLQEEESVMGMIFSRASPSLAAEVSGRVIEVLADIGCAMKNGNQCYQCNWNAPTVPPQVSPGMHKLKGNRGHYR